MKKKQKKERASREARLAALGRASEPTASGSDEAAAAHPAVGSWLGAVSVPTGKEKISLRIDADILQWFRGLGPRYQTHMNAVLRAYYEQERQRQAPSSR